MATPRCSILWVEDDDNDFVLFRRAMRGLPEIVVHRERDGAAAEKYLLETEILPTLIVSDLKMPDVTGFELLAWVRTNGTTKELPFVVFSNSNQSKDREAAAWLGATGFIVKPNKPAEITVIARGWLKFAQG